MSRTPTRTVRLVWLLLGLFFSGLTMRVLLWEVSSILDIKADHLLTVGALVGAIASGVFVWSMLRQAKLLTATGLGIAFIAATGYCLIGSAGRGDETAYLANAAARQINDQRQRARRDQGEAKTRYEAALKAEELECGSGAGPKCTAKRDTTRLRRAELEIAERDVRALPPEQRENGKLKRAAELIAFFGNRDQAEAERGLALLWPFIPPLVCELLTIVFLHLAFGSISKPQQQLGANDNAAEVPAGFVKPMKPATQVSLPPIELTTQWATRFRKVHGREPTIPEIRAAFPALTSKATAWRRIKRTAAVQRECGSQGTFRSSVN